MEVLSEELNRQPSSTLLKECRLRIGTDFRSLGDFKRLPSRIGKRVTQEEVAEAVGITRQWYAKIERNGKTRVSPSVLSRIADALTMSSRERAALFQSVLPEIRANSLAQHANEVLNRLGSLHRLTRRLWAATSEAEALEVVREFATSEFSSSIAVTRAKAGAGCWQLAGTGKHYDSDLFNKAESAVVERWGDAAIDDLTCLNAMDRPGEVLTMDERDARFPDLAVKRRPALEVLGWTHVSSAMASIRSQSGFVARLSIVYPSAHTYSQLEREQLSTLAELTSLALSVYVE